MFDVARDWQVFCGNACKAGWHKENDHCFYCGDYYAIGRDHVHSVAARGGRRVFMGQETVRCCASCNSALGDRLLEVEERIQFLIHYYTTKYKLRNTMVEWGDDEIEELGPKLKQRIKKMMAIRKRGEEQVMYLHNLAGYVEATTC